MENKVTNTYFSSSFFEQKGNNQNNKSPQTQEKKANVILV